MLALVFNRRRLRCAVWVTLAAWLFALGAGVANACVLAPHDAGDRALIVPKHLGAAAHEVRGGVGNPPDTAPPKDDPASLAHETDAGQAGCLKFCADGSSALTKNAVPTVDLGPPLLAAAEPWHVITPTARLGTRLSRGRPADQGQPLVIRLLRLTL
jgi:hypothetical protein